VDASVRVEWTRQEWCWCCNGGGRSWGSQGTRVEGRQIPGAKMTGSEMTGSEMTGAKPPSSTIKGRGWVSESVK
jgi:hypothetical protein